jgi:allophanate hydrolase subunit 2
MKGFKVINPGMHSLLQDKGRMGYHSLGITSGGAFDQYSFGWANRLCLNPENAGCIEILVGGLILEAQVSTQIAITGADMPIKINDSIVKNWCTHNIQSGDKIAFGYATAGCRSYLAVAGGIQAPLIFNSLSTVVREDLGGLN